MTKLAQIQEAIRQLPPAEQQELRHWLLDDETPEMLAAADEGLRSLHDEPTISLEDRRKRMAEWLRK